MIRELIGRLWRGYNYHTKHPEMKEKYPVDSGEELSDEEAKERFSENALKFFNNVTLRMPKADIEAFHFEDDGEIWYCWGFGNRSNFNGSLLSRMEEDNFQFLNNAVEGVKEISLDGLINDLRDAYNNHPVKFSEVSFTDIWHQDHGDEFSYMVGEGKYDAEDHKISLYLAEDGGEEMARGIERLRYFRKLKYC